LVRIFSQERDPGSPESLSVSVTRWLRSHPQAKSRRFSSSARADIGTYDRDAEKLREAWMPIANEKFVLDVVAAWRALPHADVGQSRAQL